MSDYRLLNESKPVARKQHRCIWCGQPIAAGEQYLYQRIAWDGTVMAQHWHFECEKSQLAEGRETGEWEFAPYDNERPPAQPTGGNCGCIYTDAKACDGSCGRKPPMTQYMQEAGAMKQATLTEI